jgi:opacity protein-like surface antigen
MKSVAAASLLALASIAPAQAATCPQEARLRADPRWAPPDSGSVVERAGTYVVVVGAGATLYWSGSAVTEAKLATYLGLAAKQVLRYDILLGIHERADCALLARVVTAIEAHAPADCGDDCGFELYVPGPPPPGE